MIICWWQPNMTRIQFYVKGFKSHFPIFKEVYASYTRACISVLPHCRLHPLNLSNCQHFCKYVPDIPRTQKKTYTHISTTFAVSIRFSESVRQSAYLIKHAELWKRNISFLRQYDLKIQFSSTIVFQFLSDAKSCLDGIQLRSWKSYSNLFYTAA